MGDISVPLVRKCFCVHCPMCPLPSKREVLWCLFVSGQEENNVSEDCGPVQDLRELERLDQVHDVRDHPQRDRHVGRDVHKDGRLKDHGCQNKNGRVVSSGPWWWPPVTFLLSPSRGRSRARQVHAESLKTCLSVLCNKTRRGRGSVRAQDKLGYKWCFVGASIYLGGIQRRLLMTSCIKATCCFLFSSSPPAMLSVLL